ncbi:MAG TPA: DUF805 domain-containing protein [Candidatus Coprenecus pullistercoris]|nr:DUF805 domain-containing protein [Candidatus Coprenecus pullistercoris]
MKKFTIGRNQDNCIELSDPMISEHHAEITVDDRGGMTLKDYSSNGTLVNGVALHQASCPVAVGDKVVFPGGKVLDWNLIVFGAGIEVSGNRTVPDAGDVKSESYEQPVLEHAEAEEPKPGTGKRGMPMTLFQAIGYGFRHYADFSGRATRCEFGWFMLFFGAVMTTVGWVPFLNIFVLLGLILPVIAVWERRLHDTGREGLYMLFLLIPIVGTVLLIIWGLKPGDQGTNAFGPAPGKRN